MITLKIDVTKIDKSRLFKGAKGTYLDLVLFDTEDDKYGNDFRVVQSVTKEEREKGVKGIVLGSGKIIGGKPQQPRRNDTEPHPSGSYEDSDDIPF